MDVSATVTTISRARNLLLEENDCNNAIINYETAQRDLNRHTRDCNDPYMLGRLRELQKRVAEELRACKDYLQDMSDIAGDGQAGPGPSPHHNRFSDLDDPFFAGSYDDGYRQPVVSHTADVQDPDVWRPPTRDGVPARIPQGRPAPAARARSSNEDSKAQLPQWSRNAAGGQAVMIPSGRGGDAGGHRAGPAAQQRPGAVGAGRGNAGAARVVGARQEPDRPWRQNMAAPAGKAAGGAGPGGAAAPGAKKGIPASFSGPDAELAAQLERDMLDGSPGIRWADIAGLTDAKRVLDEAAVLPLVMPEYFTGIRKPFKGVLLFGPPGTGKTMLAKAVATETGCTFFNVSSATLGSKYRGESERLVRCLFDLARVHAPSIVFIDEVDSLCSQRGSQGEHEASRRVKTELLTQVDGIHVSPPGEGDPEGQVKRVMVLAATNFPWDIDEAMRRRLEKRIYIPLPGAAERLELLGINLKDVILGNDVNLETIAQQLEGYSGDDITNICRDAALNGMRRNVAGRTPAEIKKLRDEGKDLSKEPVLHSDFMEAKQRINPSVSPADLTRHIEWNKEYGSA